MNKNQWIKWIFLVELYKIEDRIFFITTILHNFLSHNILITERKGNGHYRIADANLAVWL